MLICVGMGEVKMASPSFPVSGIRTLCSHQLAIRHPSFVSSFPPLPTSTLSATKLQPARWHLFPKFYLRWGCVSKPLTSQKPSAMTRYDPLGEGLVKQWLGASLSPGTFTCPCCCKCPETAVRCQVTPESLQDCVASAFQGL